MQNGPTGSSSIYKPPSPKQEDSDDEQEVTYSSPFYSEVQKTMRYVFGGVLKPKTLEGQHMMCPWVDLYKTKSHAFVIHGSFHQKNMEDELHLSVSYKPYLSSDIRFHIYGYWKDEFFIDRITMLAGGRVITLATY